MLLLFNYLERLERLNFSYENNFCKNDFLFNIIKIYDKLIKIYPFISNTIYYKTFIKKFTQYCIINIKLIDKNFYMNVDWDLVSLHANLTEKFIIENKYYLNWKNLSMNYNTDLESFSNIFWKRYQHRLYNDKYIKWITLIENKYGEKFINENFDEYKLTNIFMGLYPNIGRN